MTVEFSEFLPEVLPFVPGCATPVAENAIRQACIEFCEKTDYWTQDLAAMASENTVADYVLYPPGDYARIHNILSVFYDDVELEAKTPKELNKIITNWKTETGTPSYYHIEREKRVTLILVPVPDETVADQIEVSVSIKPAVGGDRVSDEIYYDHRKSISYGALGFLLRIPNKAWTSVGLANEYEKMFEVSTINARRIASKAFTKRSETVQMRPWK